MTQGDLSDASGVGRSNISRIESGDQKARLSTVRRLAAALGVAPAALMASSGGPSPAGEEGAEDAR